MFLQMYTIVFAQIRIHQTSAPPCSAAPYCACAEPPRRHQCMHRPAHVLTNSLHERELVQFIASLLKSEKQRKVLSGCLEKLTHGWSLGYSELPSGKSDYPWDHPRVNFSRQPLRTFRYFSDLSRDAVNWTSFRSCNEFVQHVRGPVHAEVW